MTRTEVHHLFSQGKVVFLLDTATELAVMRREEPASAGHRSAIALVPRGAASCALASTLSVLPTVRAERYLSLTTGAAKPPLPPFPIWGF